MIRGSRTPGAAQQGSRRRWIAGGIFAWLFLSVLVGEILDPPLDPVRVAVRLVLAGLLGWFLTWLVARSMRDRD